MIDAVADTGPFQDVARVAVELASAADDVTVAALTDAVGKAPLAPGEAPPVSTHRSGSVPLIVAQACDVGVTREQEAAVALEPAHAPAQVEVAADGASVVKLALLRTARTLDADGGRVSELESGTEPHTASR